IVRETPSRRQVMRPYPSPPLIAPTHRAQPGVGTTCDQKCVMAACVGGRVELYARVGDDRAGRGSTSMSSPGSGMSSKCWCDTVASLLVEAVTEPDPVANVGVVAEHVHQCLDVGVQGRVHGSGQEQANEGRRYEVVCSQDR